MVSKMLQDAVKKRDLIAARSAFYTIILLDPSFTKGKFNEALQYVKNSGWDNFIDEHNGEELEPEEEWNEEYFDLLAAKLQENFSEQRIRDLKRVARKLSPARQEVVEKERKKEEQRVQYKSVEKSRTNESGTRKAESKSMWASLRDEAKRGMEKWKREKQQKNEEHYNRNRPKK